MYGSKYLTTNGSVFDSPDSCQLGSRHEVSPFWAGERPGYVRLARCLYRQYTTTLSCDNHNFSAIFKKTFVVYTLVTTEEAVHSFQRKQNLIKTKNKPHLRRTQDMAANTNIQKALELINTFATGDTEKAAGLLAEGYIQHNLAYGTGRDAFVGSVAYLASAPVKTTVNNIRAFADGDKVFLQTVYNFAGAGEQVVFDIFRFDEDGRIAEHWDNLAAKAEPNPSGRTQIDGTMEKKDVDAEETRKVVTGFVGDVLRGENPDKLTSYFDGDTYIQHNTGIADGLSGLGAALAALAEQGIQMIYTRT